MQALGVTVVDAIFRHLLSTPFLLLQLQNDVGTRVVRRHSHPVRFDIRVDETVEFGHQIRKHCHGAASDDVIIETASAALNEKVGHAVGLIAFGAQLIECGAEVRLLLGHPALFHGKLLQLSARTVDSIAVSVG